MSPAERLLLGYIDRVNREPASITAADCERLREAGWTDEAIYDAVMVCALFNFYNRWIDATGVPPMDEEGHRASGARIAANGYLKG